MDSINTERSYTEYEVNEPTTDFAIGFDNYSGEDKDAIHVTLDGVNLDNLDYTVVRKNAQVIEVTPAIESGVVRLQRETYIDQAFHTFTAGALFSPKSMDENFAQVRRSQQEVNDGFTFLAENTNGVVAAAEAATVRANAAAELAENTDVAQFQLDLKAQKLGTGITATAKFGGVERTQAEKNGGTVHINDFIDPDNIPSDYWQVFTNAFSYLQSIGGGKLTLDIAKKYPVGRPLMLPTTLTLYMQGSSIVKSYGQAMPDVNGYVRAPLCTFYDDTAKNVRIYNGVLDGNGHNFFHGHNLIGWNNAKDVEIKGVTFKNVVVAHAIDAGSSEDVLIDFCFFKGYANDLSVNTNIAIEAIQIDPQIQTLVKTNGVTVTNCYCGLPDEDNTDSRFGGYPVFVGNHSANKDGQVFKNITITNNRVVNASYAAIRPYAWDDSTIADNTFEVCKVGVLLSTGTGANLRGCTDITIKNNTMGLNGENFSTGVVLDQNLTTPDLFKHKGITISDNKVHNGAYGVRVFNTDDLKVKGNTLDVSNTGVSIGGTAKQSEIFVSGDNTIKAPTGIYITGQLRDSSVHHNSFSAVESRAVHITGAGGAGRSNIKIHNNTFSASTTEDIVRVDSGASTGIYVDNNTFKPDANLAAKTPRSLVAMDITGGFNYCNNNVVDVNFSNSPYLLGSGIPVKGMIHKNPEGFVEAGQGSRLVFKKYNYYEEFAKTTNSGNTGWVKLVTPDTTT